MTEADEHGEFLSSGCGLCIDRRKRLPEDPYWALVEEQTFIMLLDHTAEGFYSRGIMFIGIDPNAANGHSGPNCIDSAFTNIFAVGQDGFFYVSIVPPHNSPVPAAKC